jgi:hypothetical protein
MYSTLAALVTVGALLWLWRDSLGARELATRISRRTCEAEGVQFLDDTVALAGVRPVFTRGRPQLRRVYHFEFSRSGDDRAGGSVTLTGAHVDTVYVTPRPAPPADDPPPQVVDIGDARHRH